MQILFRKPAGLADRLPLQDKNTYVIIEIIKNVKSTTYKNEL